MKIHRLLGLILSAGLALFLLLGPPKASANTSVSFGLFYDSLEPHGEWTTIEPYGDCWIPRVYDNDWRPYCDGRWEYTEHGWTWESDEPWGWATYHYGRWILLEDGPGWVWVPGYEWGPAWVAWNDCDDYIGWAPLPPEPYYAPRSGFSFAVSFNFGPSWYNFCETRYFGSRRLRDVVCRRDANVTIINKTVNKTKIVNNTTIINNNAPALEEVNLRSERRIERVRLARRQEADAVNERRTQRRDDALRVVTNDLRSSEQNPEPRRRSSALNVESAPVRPQERRQARVAGPEPSAVVPQEGRAQSMEPRVRPQRITRQSERAQVERVQERPVRAERRVQAAPEVSAPRVRSQERPAEKQRPSAGPVQKSRSKSEESSESPRGEKKRRQ